MMRLRGLLLPLLGLAYAVSCDRTCPRGQAVADDIAEGEGCFDRVWAWGFDDPSENAAWFQEHVACARLPAPACARGGVVTPDRY